MLALVALVSLLAVPDYEVDLAVFEGREGGDERLEVRQAGWRRDLGNTFRRVPHLEDLLRSLDLIEETEPTTLTGIFLDDEAGAPIPGVRVELDGWVADQRLASTGCAPRAPSSAHR